MVLRLGAPFSRNTGMAEAAQGIRRTVYAGQALIAARDDWDLAAQAQTKQSSGSARSDGGESAPVATLEPGRCPVPVPGRALGIALLGGIDRGQCGFSPP